MWIHLPVLPRDQPPALLYQHLPLPRWSATARWPWSAGEEQFLAVFKEANNFVPLSTSDISAVLLVRTWTSAARPRFPGSGEGSTACLPALFEERLDAAADTCSVTPLRQEEAVFRLNSTAFVIATRKPRRVDVRCGDDPKEKAGRRARGGPGGPGRRLCGDDGRHPVHRSHHPSSRGSTCRHSRSLFERF